MDVMLATIDVVIDDITKMTPLEELNFYSLVPSPTTTHTSTPPPESPLVPKNNPVPKTTQALTSIPASGKSVKHMARKKTPSWLPKRAPTMMSKFPIARRQQSAK